MINKYITFFEEHLFYILIPIIIIVGIISYNRFIVNQDFIVAYEGLCDPSTATCFLGCEDDLCLDKYFYTKMQKYSLDLYLECGNDITECEYANTCLSTNRECSITYCDVEIDGDLCYIQTNPTETQSNTLSDEILQNDNDTNL